jgi:hypothetical protein
MDSAQGDTLWQIVSMLGKGFFYLSWRNFMLSCCDYCKKNVFVFRNIPVRLFFNLYMLVGLYGCDWLFKGLVALCHSFCVFLLFFYNTYNHLLINIRWGPSPYLHSCRLSGRNLPGVPSRDSSSGLPYSKPAHYQLSCAAPYWAALHWLLRFVTLTFFDVFVCVLYVLWRNTFCDAVRYVTFTFWNFYVLCSYYLCSYV